MRKIILVLLASFLLVQCSDGDDNITITPVPGENIFLFSVNVNGNVFNVDVTGHLYLSDEDGNIIVTGALLNNQETSFFECLVMLFVDIVEYFVPYQPIPFDELG